MKILDIKEAGFTVIELMIATSVFTIILIITTTTIIGITNTYVSGSVQSQTQDTSRTMLNDISQDIQYNDPSSFTGIQYAGTNDLFYFCIGNDVYVYQLDNKLSSQPSPSGYGGQNSTVGFFRYTNSASTCPNPVTSATNKVATAPFAGSEQLLSTNERLGQLSITNSAGTQNYVITVKVAYGDDDLLQDKNPPNSNINGSGLTSPTTYTYACKSGPDSSYCSQSTLTTTVQARIN